MLARRHVAQGHFAACQFITADDERDDCAEAIRALHLRAHAPGLELHLRRHPGPPELAEQSWTAWRVHRALEELPPREREVVELAYWSGLSQSEVADYLHIPLGTVKTRTRSALARLATVLEGELA